MRKTNKLPPVELLRELLTYEPDTGNLRWTSKAFRNHGKVAGYLGQDGYIHINTLGHKWKAHRIAYALHYGIDPYPMELDHINRNRADNRITNLRRVSTSENNKNITQPNNPRRNTAVVVSYPDGGKLTARSITLAGYILNTTSLRHSLSRGHGKVNAGGKDTGIRIAYRH